MRHGEHTFWFTFSLNWLRLLSALPNPDDGSGVDTIQCLSSLRNPTLLRVWPRQRTKHFSSTETRRERRLKFKVPVRCVIIKLYVYIYTLAFSYNSRQGVENRRKSSGRNTHCVTAKVWPTLFEGDESLLFVQQTVHDVCRVKLITRKNRSKWKQIRVKTTRLDASGL